MAAAERTMSESSQTSRPEGLRRKSRLLIGATAALIALAGVFGSWALLVGNDDVGAEVSVVLANIDAWNAGEYDGYLATFTDELAEQEGGDIPQIFMNANSRIEIVEPCRVIETGPAGESTVRCVLTARDDFFGPAGFVDTSTDTFVVNAAGRISSWESQSSEIAGETGDNFLFNARYWRWLREAHPDVYREIQPEDADFGAESLPGYRRDPAHMSIAIQYVEEFVAQSDDYPISP